MGAVLLAMALCLGMTPATSHAEESEAGTAPVAASSEQAVGTATLTIVYGLGMNGDPDIVVNKKYPFAEGATVEDLFAAAKAAGDIKDYAFVDGGYGSTLNSVTKNDGTEIKNNTAGSLYWGNFKNGSYVINPGEAQSTEALADGVSYQFAWSSYPTAAAPADWTPIVSMATDGAGMAGIGAKVGTATLTIVYGLGFTGDPDIVMNKKYEFAAGATVEDLFAAAKAAGDIKGYVFSGEYISSVTMSDGTVAANAADFSLSWSTYKGGSYLSGTDGQKGEALADGSSYQLAWSSYPTAVAPSDWAAIVAAATDGSEIAPGKPGQKPEDSKYTPVALDSEAYTQLFSSIAGSFAGTAEPWEALELAAIGSASSADESELMAGARAAMISPDQTSLQKYALALTAVGIDAASIVGDDGKTLIEAMGAVPSATNTLNGKIFTLLAYKSGPYQVSAQALKPESSLIDEVLAAQLDDGGFSFAGANADADMTAMVIAALAPYRSDARVETALQNALAALQNLQREDGGFAATGIDGPSADTNVGSTAMTVVALCAAGIDPATSWATASGETPMSALLSFANESRTGFLFGSKTDEMFTEQGFRAMVAYQGFKNTGAAYNVYLQAADGVAGLPGVGPSTQTPTAPQNKLAQTGDGVAAAPIAALAVCAVTGIALAVRRRTEAVRTANR